MNFRQLGLLIHSRICGDIYFPAIKLVDSNDILKRRCGYVDYFTNILYFTEPADYVSLF